MNPYILAKLLRDQADQVLCQLELLSDKFKDLPSGKLTGATYHGLGQALEVSLEQFQAAVPALKLEAERHERAICESLLPKLRPFVGKIEHLFAGDLAQIPGIEEDELLYMRLKSIEDVNFTILIAHCEKMCGQQGVEP